MSRSDIIYENLTQISLPYIQDGRSAVYDTEETKKNRVSVSIIIFPVKPQPVRRLLSADKNRAVHWCITHTSIVNFLLNSEKLNLGL